MNVRYIQLYVLEMLLSFHAWYKHGALFDIATVDGYNTIDTAVRCMLKYVKEFVP